MKYEFSDQNYYQFIKSRMPKDYQGVLPRRTKYGYDDAYLSGLKPIHEEIDVLDWLDVKEAIQHSHEHQTQPMYHQAATWAPDGYRHDQNGLPYCWAWSLIATLQDTRAMENKTTVPLAPVGMGWLVNWRSAGYYLDDSIKGLRDRGCPPATAVGGDPNSTNRNPNSYSNDWKEQALKYRLGETWDTRTGNDKYTIQQLATIITSGRSGYFAINAMSHAMSYTGLHWDEASYLNVKFGVRNSHNEPAPIITSGARWVCDELYGFAGSRLTT